MSSICSPVLDADDISPDFVQPAISTNDEKTQKTGNTRGQIILILVTLIPSTCSSTLDNGVYLDLLQPSGSTKPEESEEISENKVSLDYDSLYDKVYQLQNERGLRQNVSDVQHKSLVPELRLYQIQAVTWMLHHEKDHPVKGGILADEMGLGKTVEVLAVILNHPREKIFQPEWMEPVEAAPVTAVQPEPERSPAKKKKEAECINCLSAYASIETVVWRHSCDKEKSTIQRVIDRYCSDIKTKKNEMIKCSCLNLKKRLQHFYIDELAQYSCLKSLYKKNLPPAAEETVSILCVCGKTDSDRSLIQCTKCHKQQHSQCVNYDVKDPYRGVYHCPQCWTTNELIHSKSTLIITPPSISHQWVEEIQRHMQCDDFKVLVYQGVSQAYHQPLTIAKNDIIITTYDVLRKELYFAEAKFNVGEKRSRRSVTYMNPPSPLLSVEFWRLCLDEAQMVEGSTTRAAEMARRLTAVHRWCVTGTPIQKSVLDLHGLFVFLNVEQYCDRRWFIDDLETPLKQGNSI